MSCLPRDARPRTIAAFGRSDTGVAAVEAAFVLPLALLFVFLIIEMSLLGFARAAVEYNAWQAARYAALHGYAGQERAEEIARSPLAFVAPSNDGTTVRFETTDGPKVAVARVAVDYSFVLPVPAASAVTLVATARHGLPGTSQHDDDDNDDRDDDRDDDDDDDDDDDGDDDGDDEDDDDDDDDDGDDDGDEEDEGD